MYGEIEITDFNKNYMHDFKQYTDNSTIGSGGCLYDCSCFAYGNMPIIFSASFKGFGKSRYTTSSEFEACKEDCTGWCR